MFLFPSLAALILSGVVVLLNGGCTVALANNATFPAILLFGDSIVDTGNNNNHNTMAKCNYPPYGRDFPGGKPTGRFSNGKVPSDIIAEFLGIKELVPAYLDPNLELQDLLTGVSFASGAAGYDPLSSELASAFSLSDQLQMLREYKEKINASLGQQQTAAFISKALFIFCCGSNDITNTYFTTPFRRLHYDIDSYTDLTVGFASDFYKGLYDLGARRIGVMGVPTIGCVPSQRTELGGLQRKCVEYENEAALLTNSKLSAMVDSLKKSLPGLKIVFLDSYYPFQSIIENPEKYGFEEATKGCCGTGNTEVTMTCNRFSDALSCRDASKFVFWDAFHPTEKAYKTLMPMVLNQKHIKELL